MILEQNAVKSLVEKVMIDKGLGKNPTMPIDQVWSAPSSSDQFSIRDLRDIISQVVIDVITDAISDGSKISVSGTFGGGNKTPGNDNIVIKPSEGKTIQVGDFIPIKQPAIDDADLMTLLTQFNTLLSQLRLQGIIESSE